MTNTKSSKIKKEYCNQFTINRAPHKSGYTVITNLLIRDERLTALDKGIMLMILANDSTKYVLNTTVLHKSTGLGKTSFYGSIEKLRELGYINKLRFQGGVRWIINEIPAPNGVLRNSDSPVSGTTEINTTESGYTEINTTESGYTESGTTESDTTESDTTEINTTENRTLISNNTNGESAEALPPLAEEKPIEEKSIEKIQKETLTNRSCNNKNGEQGDLDLGGVPVSVTLAAPPLGSLASPTPTHPPSIDDRILDDITSTTKITSNSDVTTVHTPIKVEERSDAKEKTPNVLVNSISLDDKNDDRITTPVFSPVQDKRYSDEIRNFDSKYIKNCVAVKNGYEKYSKMKKKFLAIQQYEKIMYYHCLQRCPNRNIFNEPEANKIINKEMIYHFDVIDEVNRDIDRLIEDMREDPATTKWLMEKILILTPRANNQSNG